MMLRRPSLEVTKAGDGLLRGRSETRLTVFRPVNTEFWRGGIQEGWGCSGLLRSQKVSAGNKGTCSKGVHSWDEEQSNGSGYGHCIRSTSLQGQNMWASQAPQAQGPGVKTAECSRTLPSCDWQVAVTSFQGVTRTMCEIHTCSDPIPGGLYSWVN